MEGNVAGGDAGGPLPTVSASRHRGCQPLLKIRSVAFDTFPGIEGFNPDFRPGCPKMLTVVDAEARSDVPDDVLLDRLVEAFPGLLRHRCRAPGSIGPHRPDGGRIVLLDAEPSANQAHLLEHVMLEILHQTDSQARLSGVTCTYESPPERSDVFVECADREWCAFAVKLGAEILNRALEDEALAPLYPDAIRCARLVKAHPAKTWSVARLARDAGISTSQAMDAAQAAARAGIIAVVPYSVNFSGVPFYQAAVHT